MKKLFYLLFAVIFTMCLSCDKKGKNTAFYKENKADVAYKISREYAEIPIKANIASSLTFAFQNMANGINPFFASNDMEVFIRQATMGTLLARDPATGKLVGNIAESVTVSPNLLNVVFTISKNKKFSDGNDIKISDIVADFMFLKNILKTTKIGAEYLLPGSDINIDSTTDSQITLSFSKSDPFVLERLANFPVIKKEEIVGANTDATAEMSRKPVYKTYCFTKERLLRINCQSGRKDTSPNEKRYTMLHSIATAYTAHRAITKPFIFTTRKE